MENKKFWIVAKFEFKETVRKPSFWLATLFLPILLGVISFVTSYASMDAVRDFEEGNGQFEKIYIVDNAGIIETSLIQDPYEIINNRDLILNDVKNDPDKLLVEIPNDFATSFEYELIFKKDERLLAAITMPPVINSLLKQSALTQIEDPLKAQILTSDPSSVAQSFDEEGNLVKENFGQYVLPVISLVIFFLAVFISSSFLLQSVSAEKENRMIETMLSIIDKKSLMIGKMVGLIGVVLVQLFIWLSFSGGIFFLIQNSFEIPIPIDFGQIDVTLIPTIIYLIFTGFLFFGAIMTGTGAIGTGAQDSKNLSSIFILLAIFPIYLMQILITDPAGTLSQIFTYFPFTSHMIILFRYSLGAIDTWNLVLALVISTLYSILALWLSFKLFELGCLMYNRRPSFKEMFNVIKE